MAGRDTDTRSALDSVLLAALAAARGLAGIAALLCSALATVDTIGLWLFASPVPSVLEITQMLLIVIVFLGLGAAERGGDHITVDVVRDMLPLPVRRVGDIVVQLVSIAVYLGLLAAGVAAALRSWSVREVADGVVALPVYPFRFLLVVGLLLATAAAVSVLFRPHPEKPGRDRAAGE